MSWDEMMGSPSGRLLQAARTWWLRVMPIVASVLAAAFFTYEFLTLRSQTIGEKLIVLGVAVVGWAAAICFARSLLRKAREGPPC